MLGRGNGDRTVSLKAVEEGGQILSALDRKFHGNAGSARTAVNEWQFIEVSRCAGERQKSYREWQEAILDL